MPRGVFVSGVSDDYRKTRVDLAAELRKAGFHAVIQEEFVELGLNTLMKLAAAVGKETGVVIHMVGPRLGSVPPAKVLAAFLIQLGGESAVRAVLSTLFESDAYRRLTYTQWEAWLAVFYGKPLLICKDTAPADPPAPPAGFLAFLRGLFRHRPAAPTATNALPAVEHLKLLTAQPGYAIDFATFADLSDKVKTSLLRLQNLGSFHEDKPRNLPMATLGELFIGRDPFLKKLGESFRAARGAHPTAYPNHLIHGVGGVGKTRAAVEYGLRSEHLYAALLFVNGETASDLERTLADLAGVLKLNLPAAATNPERLSAVADWLKAHPGWLLVVDNVDDQAARDAVNGWLAQWHGGHVVITGRYVEWGPEVVQLELTVLAPTDARDFLLRATEGRRKAKPDDGAVARSIAVDDLGQLCLALGQASAYVRHRRIALAEYRARWQANAKDVRTWANKVLMKYHEEKTVSLSIATTWQTSMDQLSADARRLLEMLSWLAPDPIPQTVFTGLEQTGAFADTEPLRVELDSYSFLQRADDAGFDSPGKVHRLVQLITREQLPDPKPTLTAMLKGLRKAAPAPPQDVRTWPVWNPLQPHVTVAVQHGDSSEVADPTATLLNELGVLLWAKALYADAEPLMRRALAIDEATYGPDHTDVAIRLNNLASLLQDTGRLGDAEPLMRRTLAITEKALGPDHSDVAVRLNNLATLLYDTGRLGDAEPLMRRALAIGEKVYGPDHPTVALRLNNLASLLQATGRPADAEPLKRRVLAIDEKVYGPDHPTVARDLNNLALLLQDTGRLGDAEPLMRRALAIDEKVYGPDHPTVALRLNNLASLLQATGRPADAEPLYRRAVDIFHRVSVSVGHPLPNLERGLRNYRIFLEEQNLPADEVARRLAPFQLPVS